MIYIICLILAIALVICFLKLNKLNKVCSQNHKQLGDLYLKYYKLVEELGYDPSSDELKKK